MAEIFSSINASTPNSVARAIANEVVAGKNAIASALVSKGQSVTNVDTFNTMASKILAVTGEVNVTPLQNIPSDWHDLAQVVAANTLSEYPYSYAILLSKGMESISLTGSNRYITSDGGFYSGDQMHTFDISKDNASSDTYAKFSGTLCGMSSSVTITANQVGSVGNIKLTGNGTSINNLIAAWNAANPTKQITLSVGDGTQIPLSGFYGLVAGMTTAVEICQNAGGDWGQITLVANGTSNVATLISAWNSANPTKQITLKSGVDTQVPTANIILKTEDIQLTGGSIGNAGKSTRWVIFCNNSDNIKPNYNFNTITNNEGLNYSGKLLAIYLNSVKIDNLVLTSVKIPQVIFSSIYPSSDISIYPSSDISIYSNQFKGNNITQLIFPPNITTINANNSNAFDGCSGLTSLNFGNASVINLGPYMFLGCGITYFELKQGVTSFLANTQCFVNNLSLSTFYLPNGMTAVVIGTACFSGCSALKYIRLSNPSTTFSFQSNAVTTSQTNIALETGFAWTVNFSAATSLTHDCLVAMLASLVDYRANGSTTPTITANGTSGITGVNTQFTKVHHVGETIYINSVAKIINSITDDTHMVMTTTVASGSGLSYGANKVLTIGSTNIAKLTAAELLVGTNKGWTIA